MEIKNPFWHPSKMSAFLLDWDGVIAETKLSFTEIRERYYRDNADAMLLEDSVLLEPKEREALMQDLYDLETEGAKQATAVAGAKELLEWLNANEISYCIISRNCMDSITMAAEKIGVELPEVCLCRDNSDFLKPDPRALFEAAAALGVAPSNCVVLGDYIYDLQAAKRAGMRSILVRRIVPEWECWADACYAELTDFVGELKYPVALVPSEYKEIYAKRGDRWMKGVRDIVLQFPDKASPNIDTWLCRAAELGVGMISVSPQVVLTPQIWQNNRSFDCKYLGHKLLDIAEDFLSSRFPLVKIIEGEEGLKAPKNSLDLVRFLERKIYK